MDRHELEALVEALIEEARQRARRRRRITMAVAAAVLFVGVSLFTLVNRAVESGSSSAAAAARLSLAGGKLKVVIEGTNDRPDVTDGTLVGRGTFKASGAMTDAGTALAYRTVSADGTLITLRFVTKGRKGTVRYVVKINATSGTSRWTISSGTGAYAGLHGSGTESENASYTVSTLRGTVSRR